MQGASGDIGVGLEEDVPQGRGGRAGAGSGRAPLGSVGPGGPHFALSLSLSEGEDSSSFRPPWPAWQRTDTCEPVPSQEVLVIISGTNKRNQGQGRPGPAGRLGK